MLVLAKMLRVFFDTLTADDKYFPLNRDNLLQQIQILLSQKQKTLSRLFFALLKSTLNFEHFQKKKTLIAYAFPKLEPPK